MPDIPEGKDSEAARWISLLSHATNSAPFVVFGARASESLELCEAFIRLCEGRADMSVAIQQVAIAVRAICAQLQSERRNEPPTIRWWPRSDVEPGWLKLLKRAPTPGRMTMFGAYVGRSVERCSGYLKICESHPHLPEPLQCAADGVRVVLAQLKSRDAYQDGIPEEARSSRLWRKPALLAVACLSFAVSGISLKVSAERAGWEFYSTKVGDYRRLQLRDGSTLELNTASDLQYRDSQKLREVVLSLGEAHFKVAHDAARRPFVVFAGNTVIQDIGTEFSVRVWEDGKVTVLVVEGEVAMSRSVPRGILQRLLPASEAPPAADMPIKAGRKATFAEGKLSVNRMSDTQIGDQESWRNNELRFEAMSLQDIVGEINRYSNRKLEIADPAIAGRVLGGKISIKPRDVDGALVKLNAALPICVSVPDLHDGTVMEIYGVDSGGRCGGGPR